MAFCSFCNNAIPKGTGELYVLRDGTALSFCSSKCKNNYALGREGRLLRWTSKQAVLTTEKKAEEKKESALAKEIEAKLKEKEEAKKQQEQKK